MGVSKIIIMAFAGQILDRVVFPFNYQIVFIGSFVFDLLAFYFINQVQIPDQEPAATSAGCRRAAPGADQDHPPRGVGSQAIRALFTGAQCLLVGHRDHGAADSDLLGQESGSFGRLG